MTTTQTDEIKTWQQRLEETCPALGPMHIHACVEEVNDAMQAEINDLRVALQEQAREGEAVAPSAILARGRFHFFKGEDGEPDDWEWFEEGTNCAHGCIDAVIVRADAISAPQPAQPEQGEREEVIELLKQGAAISRDRGINLDFAKIADRAANLLQSAQPVALPNHSEQHLDMVAQPADEALLRQAMDALNGVLDAPKDSATQFWSCSGGVYEAVQCKAAINAIRAHFIGSNHGRSVNVSALEKRSPISLPGGSKELPLHFMRKPQ